MLLLQPIIRYHHPYNNYKGGFNLLLLRFVVSSFIVLLLLLMNIIRLSSSFLLHSPSSLSLQRSLIVVDQKVFTSNNSRSRITSSIIIRKQQQRQTIRMMTSSSSSYSLTDEKNIRESLLNCPTITLRNGMKHPIIGYGTYKVGYIPPSASSSATSSSTESPQKQRTAEECVFDALSIGYRFIECAQFYGNEKEVGNGIIKSGVPRNELFLCSKVWTTTIELGSEAIRKQLDTTLSNLQTNYIDLYLIHWPVPIHHVTAYKTIIELKNEGKIKGIGVSNYAIEDYYELKNDPNISNDDLPLVNQIEINPFLYRKNTIELFQKENAILQSYRSLRDGKVMEHPTLISLSNKYNKSVSQILGKWCIQHSFIYIPKTIQYHRMIENADVFNDNFILNDNDMNILNALTTSDALDSFQLLYQKCVNRDTTKDGTMDNVKMNITID